MPAIMPHTAPFAILHDANRAGRGHCLIVIRAGMPPKKKRQLSRYPRLMEIDLSNCNCNGAAYAIEGDAHLGLQLAAAYVFILP